MFWATGFTFQISYVNTHYCTFLDVAASKHTSTHTRDACRVANVGTLTYLKIVVNVEAELAVEVKDLLGSIDLAPLVWLRELD